MSKKTNDLFSNMTEELAEQLEGTALCSPEILTQCEVCGKVGPTGDIITLWMGDDPTPNNPTGDTTICHECLHKHDNPVHIISSKPQTEEENL